MENCVYILHSDKLNRYYIGFTQNLEKRLLFHKNSEGRKFTAKADDWTVFLTIICNDKNQGLLVEKHIKEMKSNKYIQNLKKYPEMQDKLLKRFY